MPCGGFAVVLVPGQHRAHGVGGGIGGPDLKKVVEQGNGAVAAGLVLNLRGTLQRCQVVRRQPQRPVVGRQRVRVVALVGQCNRFHREHANVVRRAGQCGPREFHGLFVLVSANRLRKFGDQIGSRLPESQRPEQNRDRNSAHVSYRSLAHVGWQRCSRALAGVRRCPAAVKPSLLSELTQAASNEKRFHFGLGRAGRGIASMESASTLVLAGSPVFNRSPLMKRAGMVQADFMKAIPFFR